MLDVVSKREAVSLFTATSLSAIYVHNKVHSRCKTCVKYGIIGIIGHLQNIIEELG